MSKTKMTQATVFLSPSGFSMLPPATKILTAKLGHGVVAEVEYPEGNELKDAEQREFELGYNGYTPPEGAVVVAWVQTHAKTKIPLFELNPREQLVEANIN